MRNLTGVVAGLSLSLCLGCASASGTYRPGEAFLLESEFDASQGEIFDATLAVAHELNLSVAVLERESGLVRFENASLSASELDKYCDYPLLNSSGGDFDTFSNWNTRSLRAGGGPVSGSVSLTFLVSTKSASTASASIRSNWKGGNRNEVHALPSTGVLEGELEDAVRARLGIVPDPQEANETEAQQEPAAEEDP